MVGKWRITIEGDGGFARSAAMPQQAPYDADVMGRDFIAHLLAMKQNLDSAQFTSYPPMDQFAKDLLVP